MRGLIRGLLATGVFASSALAQSAPSDELPDRFQIDTGYFRVKAETVLRFDGSSDISFEKDLGVNENVDTYWLDATWRVGRRHQLKLSYTNFSRDQPGFQLQRDFQWGGETYNAGLTASSSTGSDILGGYYRFALVRNPQFEIGPTIGIGYLWLKADIRATGTITAPGGSQQTRTVEGAASTGSVTGAVGGYANAWPTKRLVLRADYLYIKVSPGDSTASVSDGRIGADYYFFRHAGLGVQYKYNKYRYDRGTVVSELGGEQTIKGFQAFLSFLF